MRTLTLLLADGRLPAGGHAHSNGVEEACGRGLIADIDDLGDFLIGRLQTSGVLSMHVAAAACASARRGNADIALWAALDAEMDARLPAPGARLASRRQGAHLLRTTAGVVGHPTLDRLQDWRRDPHHPIVLGVAAAAGDVGADAAASLAGYHCLSGAVSAAIRLLGLDPVRTSALIAGRAAEVDSLAAEAAGAVGGPGWSAKSMPALAAPVSDLLAEAHRQRKERLFAS